MNLSFSILPIGFQKDNVQHLERFLVSLDGTLRQAMLVINHTAKGIALVIDGDHHLEGVLTDGDIRRALLAGAPLDAPVRDWMTRNPVSAPVAADDQTVAGLMSLHRIRQVPILDETGRLVDLQLDEALNRAPDLQLHAVIMAGGLGTRLRPLTDRIPKPMLPVGDRPLMEFIVEQLRRSGIRRVSVATCYLPEKIKAHFGDGQAFGIDLDYIAEDQPLGTAGALGLLNKPQEPLLVINGDILTRIDFEAMLSFHRSHNADLTVAVRQYDLQVPYGVIECDGALVRGVQEKPVFQFLVNAGIYLLEPSVHALIPGGRRFDMTDLIQNLLDHGRRVVSFPVVEYWLDIGRHVDYEQAQEDARNGRLTS